MDSLVSEPPPSGHCGKLTHVDLTVFQMGTSVPPTCVSMEPVWICTKPTPAAVNLDTKANTATSVSDTQHTVCDDLVSSPARSHALRSVVFNVDVQKVRLKVRVTPGCGCCLFPVV